VEAAWAHFAEPHVESVVESRVRSAAAARRIVRRAGKQGAIICHTLVSPNVREVVSAETESLLVPTVDILGPVVNVLQDRLQVEPLRQPGLSHELHREQFNRLDAVEFSLTHDDGRRPEGYAEADVVLVGVSRVSKSVTCLFLAYRGIRAANVAFTPDFEPPKQLLTLDPRKVIALKMNARRLQMLRESRGERWAGAMHGYAEPRQIARELAEFEQFVDRHGWRSIDVSYKAVEDVASEISRMLETNA
jgi:regulator of PEP synthase PpsR (kinase-PPPase family)